MATWTKRAQVAVITCCVLAVVWLTTLQLELEVETPGLLGRVDIDSEWVGGWRNLTTTEMNYMSELSRRMFLEESITDRLIDPPVNQTAKFTILVWKHGKMLENRFLHRFSRKSYNPYESCSVSNCAISYDERDLATADVVLFHLHRTKGVSSLPNVNGSRPGHQRWVFFTDESPHHVFLDHSKYNHLENYDNVFNWSMLYRMDADVPVPYGRAMRLEVNERPAQPSDRDVASNKTKLVAILGSNCGGPNNRWKYVKLLQAYMSIDVYGRCGNLTCAGHYGSDCPALASYKFYLSFENSNCHEYITEKTWHNAYNHDAVPVIMGASPTDCARHLPPRSYIHTEDFASPRELAEYLLKLDRDDKRYNEYFRWKDDFRILNEHGYMSSPVFHYCRLCQALNFNNRDEKVYTSMNDYMSVEKYCYKQSWKLN